MLSGGFLGELKGWTFRNEIRGLFKDEGNRFLRKEVSCQGWDQAEGFQWRKFCSADESFPGGSEGKNPPARSGHTWVRKIPWRRKRQPTPVFLPGKSHEQRSLVGYSPWGHQESDTTEQLNNDNKITLARPCRPVGKGPDLELNRMSITRSMNTMWCY